jgi:hypothetical protein
MQNDCRHTYSKWQFNISGVTTLHVMNHVITTATAAARQGGKLIEVTVNTYQASKDVSYIHTLEQHQQQQLHLISQCSLTHQVIETLTLKIALHQLLGHAITSTHTTA